MNLLMLLALASGAEAMAANCQDVRVPSQRLACYERLDRAAPVVEPLRAPDAGEAAKDDDSEVVAERTPIPRIRWVVRNDADPYPNPGAKFGPNGGQISYERERGEEYVSANLAVMAIFNRNRSSDSFDEKSTVEWQPFAFGQWRRKEASGAKSDVRTFGLGLAIVKTPEDFQEGTGFNIWPAISARRDLYSGVRYDIASVHVDVIRNDFYSPDLDSVEKTAYAFTPFFGFTGENQNIPSSPDQLRASAYAGFGASARLSRISPRLEVSARWQYFHDLRHPDGTDARSDDFASVGISYLLFDPADKEPRWRPKLSLVRDIGINPLVSSEELAETRLTLTIEADTW